MRSLFRPIFKLTSGRLIQQLLERNILYSQYLLGIGSGSDVFCSGEKAIFEILRNKTTPPYCIFDVGTNKGQFLKLCLENISRDDFQIHCFEPGNVTFDILSKNCINDNRIHLNNFGIGIEKIEAELYYDIEGSGLASLTKRKLDHFGIEFNRHETISIDTIDNYCKENHIDKINLLKIDIEGHELDALAGAKDTFGKFAIDVVTFEFGGCNIDTRTFFQDYWYFFQDLDFSIYRITPSGYIYPISLYKEIYEQFRTTNFIAIRNNLK